ncbi:hypothetical protein SLEP1_g32443 [Rubroshorea leprosula]|uniref:LAGLIDADG homing endonuclease n=1 Tax=Rubroshorea leprosula TaxID=152421 RepID=A0AAV5KDD1_9ROSI|nr:hypothetical protein SLEP1_g32443 [Rubroshorea leprosula]
MRNEERGERRVERKMRKGKNAAAGIGVDVGAGDREKNKNGRGIRVEDKGGLVFSPSFLVLKPIKNPEISPPSLQKPDLLCFALSAGCSCCGGELLGFWFRELPPADPTGLPQSASSGSLLVNSGSRSFCQLVRELSARFYASEEVKPRTGKPREVTN